MMNETPEAALRSRIADLEQQLKLADEGTSRLAQRCLELEKQLQTFYAAHPQKERQTDSPALVQPLLYYDAGAERHGDSDLRIAGGRVQSPSRPR